jgi:GalNAc-alpha-(1->4)-GalNAc-alpha-(1->3)-diNAcBac-PP-undecaprenol alpha-1,4-N-acetyl-D-galactosaminyltransferase
MTRDRDAHPSASAATERLSVTLAISSLRGGGAERVVSWLASQLVADGHAVTLVLDSSPETDFYRCDPRVRIVRARQATGNGLARSWSSRTRRVKHRLSEQVGLPATRAAGATESERRRAAFGAQVRHRAEAERADAILSFVDMTNLAVLQAMQGSRIPVIVQEVSQPFAREELDPVSQRLRPLLYPRAHALAVPSQQVADQARARWSGTHTVAIPNAMCLDRVGPPAGSRREVLCVGSLRAVKDHQSLIEAWALSRARQQGWTLKIVGEGPLRPILEASIARLGLGDTVTLPGATVDIAAYYAAAGVFVLPSRVEGFGNALVEAMAHGCACIATSCPGGPVEILDGGDHGLLVPPGDPASLAEAIDRLTSDTALRERLSAAALARAAHYAPGRIYQLWNHLIRRAAAMGAQPSEVRQAPLAADRTHPEPSMRILLVSESLWGGTGRVIAWLASRLVEDGHAVTLLLRSREETDWYAPDARVTIVRETPGAGVRSAASSAPTSGGAARRSVRSTIVRVLRRLARMARSLFRVGRRLERLRRDVRFAIAIRREVQKRDSEVVVSFLRLINIAVLAGMARSPVPVIVSERSHPFAYDDLDPIRRRLRPILYRRAEKVVVLTDEIAALAERNWAIERPTVIQNAIPITVPDRVPSMEERARIVVCVGRLHPHKDQMTLIEGWGQSGAAARGWKLIIVGEGSLRPELEAAIDRLGLGASVSLVGRSTDVAPYYLAARVFVLPSLLEGFPNALVEAMACGCACIATRCPGATREILDDGAYGVLVPPQDAPALAAALDDLTSDADLCSTLGAAARSRSADYLPATIYRRWLDLLRSAANGAAGARLTGGG